MLAEFLWSAQSANISPADALPNISDDLLIPEVPSYPLRRRLALYPECAVMTKLTERRFCCQQKVKSEAGRDYCYNDVIWPENTFLSCAYTKTNPISAFNCCDNMSRGNLYMAYDCKVETIGEERTAEHQEALDAVLYPECAVISYRITRERCCDEKVKSEAGRSFCYNDLIHAANKFDGCKLGTTEAAIECCEARHGREPDIAYDCFLETVGMTETTKYLQVKRQKTEEEEAKKAADEAEAAAR